MVCGGAVGIIGLRSDVFEVRHIGLERGGLGIGRGWCRRRHGLLLARCGQRRHQQGHRRFRMALVPSLVFFAPTLVAQGAGDPET